MATVSPGLLELLWHDFDFREERLREIATERLRQVPPPALEDYVVATYFLALRTRQLRDIGHEIAYHATSGIHHPPEGSLLAECTGEAVGVGPVAGQRVGPGPGGECRGAGDHE